MELKNVKNANDFMVYFEREFNTDGATSALVLNLLNYAGEAFPALENRVEFLSRMLDAKLGLTEEEILVAAKYCVG